MPEVIFGYFRSTRRPRRTQGLRLPFFIPSSSEISDGMGGKASGKQKTALSIKGRRLPHRAPPPADLPPGGIVPRSVMKQLQEETLAGDQRPYNLRLQQLLTLRELSKRGGEQ